MNQRKILAEENGLFNILCKIEEMFLNSNENSKIGYIIVLKTFLQE